MEAIELNGAAVEGNRRAFDLGRWAVAAPDDLARHLARQHTGAQEDTSDPVDLRARHLAAYQSERLAARYRAFVARVPDADLREAVARGYHKLLSYKDEYEVARLLSDARAKASARFEGDLRLRFHLAPPLLSGTGPDGRPRKRAFGQWLLPAFRLLARLKFLRGTPADPFGWTAERRMERRLIRDYERDMDEALARLSPGTREAVRELAELPLAIRGFGPVKAQAAEAAIARRDSLMAEIRTPGGYERVAAA